LTDVHTNLSLYGGMVGPSLPCAIMTGSTNRISMKVNFFAAQA
jgi:hypothetical protein